MRAAVRADARPAGTTRRSALQRQLVPVARLLGAAHGVPGLKAALKLLGYDVGLPRPPLAPLPEAASRRCARRSRSSRKSPHEPAPRHRPHPARPRPEPDRAARDARDGGADAQPSRSADAARCSTTCASGWTRLFRAADGSFAFAVSGTGTSGMETAVANLVREGTRAHGRRHRLLRRSPRADVRALRRDRQRGWTSSGAGRAIPKRCARS